jgi:tyrosine-protein kinase Etk/Wzc
MPTSPLQLGYAGEHPIIFSDDRDTDLRSYLDTLLANAWLIGWVTVIITLVGTLYAFTARPVYETSLMVQVEEKGQRDPKSILGEAGAIIDYKTAASAEVELMRSRLVIARAIDRLGLNISARPDRVPVLGSVAAGMGLATISPSSHFTAPMLAMGIEVTQRGDTPCGVGLNQVLQHMLDH